MKKFTQFIVEGKLTPEQESRLDELKKALAGLGYRDYVIKLKEMLEDPKAKGLIEGAFGGDLAEETLTLDTRPILASKLVPTQNEIDVEKSLKWGLKDVPSIDKYFNQPVDLKIPLLTYNGQFIIDGHHRWSQVACFNPKAKCKVINYSGDLSPIEMLKATQGSIAADTGEVFTKPVKGLNLLESKIKDIQKYIEDNIQDDVVEAICKYVPKLKSKDDVVKYIVFNVKKMQANNTPIAKAPEREFMPQTDEDPKIHDTLKDTTKIE